MLREDTVFGPIRSRRLGSSLGINLLPRQGKLCNFDCIYCECGWNRDGLGDTVLPTAAEVRSRLEDKLLQLFTDGVAVDSITFSGDGEPTLNPDFPRIVDDTLMLRDAYMPDAVVSVLSNATRIHLEPVFEALSKVDKAILKLDAPTNGLCAKINKPAPGYDVRKVVEAMKRFKGRFILQTMFLRSPDFDSSSPEVLGPWMDIVREVKPSEIMAYTVDRPAPAAEIMKFSAKQIGELLAPLAAEGFTIQISA